MGLLLGAFMSLQSADGTDGTDWLAECMLEMANSKCYVILFILNQVTFPFSQWIFYYWIYSRNGRIGEGSPQKSWTNFDGSKVCFTKGE